MVGGKTRSNDRSPRAITPAALILMCAMLLPPLQQRNHLPIVQAWGVESSAWFPTPRSRRPAVLPSPPATGGDLTRCSRTFVDDASAKLPLRPLCSPLVLLGSSADSDGDAAPPKTPVIPNKKKRKKKRSIVINAGVLGKSSLSSEGRLVGRGKSQGSDGGVAVSALGVPSKKRKKRGSAAVASPGNTGGGNAKSRKIQRQRTGNGTVDSSVMMIDAKGENKRIEVQAAKRGQKTVTVVRGMSSSLEDRKALLKELKSKLGVGGTLVDGVLEVQGSHSQKVLSALQARGYTGARIVGK